MRILDLFRAWLHDYFRHPLPSLRAAITVHPRRLYAYFGRIVKAVPLSRSERALIDAHPLALPLPLLREARREHDPLAAMCARYALPAASDDIPSRCNFCDFYLHGLPCPNCNTLPDGSTVCDTHRYIIIKQPFQL